jgi:hypothetical protein
MRKKHSYLTMLAFAAGIVTTHAQNTFPATGNVGIGTTSPQAKLSFVDLFSTGADGITWYSGSPISYGIYKTAGGWTGPDYQQLKLSWQTGIVLDPGSAYGRSFVDVQGAGIRVTSGNVGIGTTNAQAKLSFADLFSTAADGITWYSGSPTSYGIYKTAGGWTAPDYQQLKLSWQTGIVIDPGSFYGKSYLEVQGAGIKVSTGSITVGNVTQPAGYKMYVETGILTEKVKVAIKSSADWADHVFNKEYPLMPLDHVAQFIQQYKHLPGITSAEEMVKEGNDLGKTDAKLLEKIEELTLYLIEIKKENKIQNDLQQKEIETLKEKLKKLENN